MPRTPKPVSRKQLAANRTNAAQSTGPRPPQPVNSQELVQQFVPVEESDRLKVLRPELPNEPIFDAQPEPNETTCTPENEPISLAGQAVPPVTLENEPIAAQPVPLSAAAFQVFSDQRTCRTLPGDKRLALSVLT